MTSVINTAAVLVTAAFLALAPNAAWAPAHTLLRPDGLVDCPFVERVEQAGDRWHAVLRCQAPRRVYRAAGRSPHGPWVERRAGGMPPPVRIRFRTKGDA